MPAARLDPFYKCFRKFVMYGFLVKSPFCWVEKMGRINWCKPVPSSA